LENAHAAAKAALVEARRRVRMILFVWVFVPMLMVLLASWLTGRFVSGWYADKVSGT
jgi:uncharacterized membrane protein